MNKQQTESNAILEILNEVYVFGNESETETNVLETISTTKSKIEKHYLEGLHYEAAEKNGSLMHLVVTEINKANRVLHPLTTI